MPAQGPGVGAAVAAQREAAQKRTKKKRLDAAVKEFERMHGPLAMRTADTPKQKKMRPKRKAKRIADAAERYAAQRGPLAMRTADTPWQVTHRRERALDRVFQENRDYGPTSGGSDRIPVGGPRGMSPVAGWNSITPEIAQAYGDWRRQNLQAGVGAADEFQVDLRDSPSMYQGYPVDTDNPFMTGVEGARARDFFTEDIPHAVAGAFPGAGDIRGQVRMGAQPVDVLPFTPEAKTPIGKAYSRNVETSMAGILSALGETPQQWVDDFLGIPGAGYMMIDDPVGFLKANGESFVAMAQNPAANMGHITLMLAGVMGGGRGAMLKAPMVLRALRDGAVMEAAKIMVGSPHRRSKYGVKDFRALEEGAKGRAPRTIAYRLEGGGQAFTTSGLVIPRRLADAQTSRAGRVRASNRQVDADLNGAIDAALLRRAAPKKWYRRAGLDNAEGIAVWMANSQRMPREVIMTLEEHLAQAVVDDRQGAIKRLTEKLDAAREADALDYVIRDIQGKVIINPRFGKLAEVQDWARRRSDFMGEKKATMAEAGDTSRYGVPKETQRRRLVSQWAAMGGVGRFITPARARLAARELTGSLEAAQREARSAMKGFAAAGKATPEMIAATKRRANAIRLSTRSMKTIARLEPHIQKARALRLTLENELGVLEELQKNAESSPDSAVIKAFETQRQDVAVLSKRYARESKYYEAYQQALNDHFKAGEELGMSAQELEAFTRARDVVRNAAGAEAENAQMFVTQLEDAIGTRLRERGYVHGEPDAPPPEWLTYTTGRTQSGRAVDVHAPNAGRDVSGIPRPWRRNKPFTGTSIEQGSFDINAVKAIARENLEYAQVLERVETWQQLRREGLTAQELLDQLESGEMNLRHVRAVRIKGGTTTAAQKALLEEVFGGAHADQVFSPNLWRHKGKTVQEIAQAVIADKDLTTAHIGEIRRQVRETWEAQGGDPKASKAMEDLAIAVADVTDVGEQVRFFDNRKYKVQTHVLGHEHGAMTALNLINSVFKMSLLFGHLTGYAFPQVVGMFAMQLMEEGVWGAARMITKTPHVWRQLSPEAKATIQAMRGAGIARAADPTGERNPLRVANQKMADAFGLVIDSPFRTSAFLRYAELLGYKVKIKGFDKAGPIYDVSQIEELVRKAIEDRTSLEHDDMLTIEHLVGEEYGRFSRLGPTEKTIAQFIFFYPWLRASAVYAARLPFNHPVKTALLANAGKVSQEQTEEKLVEAIIRAVRADPEEARQLAQKFMDEYPGIFVTGEPDAQGNISVINPQSAATLQMPFDISQILKGLYSGEPTAELLRMGSPIVALLGQLLPGGYNTRFGEPESGDMNLGERLGKQAKGYVPLLTMLARLGIWGHQSDAATFGYTPKQAVAQMVEGSIAEKGLITKNMVEQIRRDDQEAAKGGAHAGQGISRTGETTTAAKNVFWLKHHPNQSDPELMRYAISRRKVEDEYQRQYEARQAGDHKVTEVDKIWIMVDVLMRMRPGVATRQMADEWKRMADSGDEFLKDTAYSEVNAFLHFSDIFGRQIETEIGNIRGDE